MQIAELRKQYIELIDEYHYKYVYDYLNCEDIQTRSISHDLKNKLEQITQQLQMTIILTDEEITLMIRNENLDQSHHDPIKKERSNVINNIGLMYCLMSEDKLAEKYYLMAIELGNSMAMNNLATIYMRIIFKTPRIYQLIEKYLLMVLIKDNYFAYYNLGVHYCDLEQFDAGIECLTIAVERKKIHTSNTKIRTRIS